MAIAEAQIESARWRRFQSTKARASRCASASGPRYRLAEDVGFAAIVVAKLKFGTVRPRHWGPAAEPGDPGPIEAKRRRKDDSELPRALMKDIRDPASQRMICINPAGVEYWLTSSNSRGTSALNIIRRPLESVLFPNVAC